MPRNAPLESTTPLGVCPACAIAIQSRAISLVAQYPGKIPLAKSLRCDGLADRAFAVANRGV